MSDIKSISQENTPADDPALKVPCEVYSRIVGYLRPVDNWNTAKQQEFKDRKVFTPPQEADHGR